MLEEEVKLDMYTQHCVRQSLRMTKFIENTTFIFHSHYIVYSSSSFRIMHTCTIVHTHES